MKLQVIRKKTGDTFFITIPRPLVLAKGWGKGTELEVVINRDGNLLLKEKA